jgi:hypothetical protein
MNPALPDVRRNIRNVLLITALFLFPTYRARAQPLGPGTRIRVWSQKLDPHQQIGAVVRMTNDSLLFLGTGDRDTSRLLRADVHDLAVSKGARKHRGAAALIGVFSGALIGGILAGSAAAHDRGGQGIATGGGAITGALVGTVIGSVFGIRAESWQTVPR